MPLHSPQRHIGRGQLQPHSRLTSLRNGSGQSNSQLGRSTPGKAPRYPLHRMLSRLQRRSLAPDGIRTAKHRARRVVIIATTGHEQAMNSDAAAIRESCNKRLPLPSIWSLPHTHTHSHAC